MSAEIDDLAARGFAEAAEAYERGRPEYPAAAIDLLVEALGIGLSSLVVDLGAGTGKLTRAFLPTGARVMAVEPLHGMRLKLAEMVPGAEVVEGVAEAIPLPDGGADAVVAGQAFHWFDSARALPEIHRVLSSEGGLGVVWNERDDSADWVRELWQIVYAAERRPPEERYPAGGGSWRGAIEASGLFTPVEERVVPHRQPVDHQTVVDLVASRSYVGVLPDRERRRLLDRVSDFLATHPAAREGDQLVVPYRTEVYWCHRR